MIHPVKKVYITQEFGKNPDSYAKFGFKGHNGLDYRAFMPNGDRCTVLGKSEVFSPHIGKILENAYDPKGYGNYVKIENDKEGSVLAHLHNPSHLKVGDFVNEGDLIGYQGTTGNSTGIHLHWGYYRIPRDRQNGYGGMIDQIPYLALGGNMADVATLEKDLAEQRKQVSNLQKQVDGLLVDLKKKDEIIKELMGKIVEIPGTNMSKWKENGMTVETLTANGKVTVNYELK